MIKLPKEDEQVMKIEMPSQYFKERQIRCHQREISNGTLIDTEKVKLLSMLVKRTNAKIVLHSEMHQVKTDPSIGLTIDDVYKAEKMLLLEI